MLVSAIALAVVCVVSFTIIPMLWWEPRKARRVASSGLLRNFTRPAISTVLKAHSGHNHMSPA